ncbi:ABC transporter permease [Halopseudomonas sp.]|uniref:ABC transporter permease n=1 Tax=Halopseudomonas sp. TaxID=2901191 RepID=UPI00300368BD
MIATLPLTRRFRWTYAAYVLVFFVYLAAPLLVVGVFAFNDSRFPALPWQGFTLDWFIANTPERTGLIHDRGIIRSVGVSALVAGCVTFLAVTLATLNAFLFERCQFPGKNLLFILMLLPLVIPGVILGISILIFASRIANYFDFNHDILLDMLRPGLLLVVLGQFAFLSTIATLVISARLRTFDVQLEEAARNLGASPLTAVLTVTLPFLAPAMIGAGLICFLMSFENFNTTLMLVGSDATLTITLFSRLREGATPVLNAVSLLLMLGSMLLALLAVRVQKRA